MRDLGDFQTPPALVSEILGLLAREGWLAERVLEPTCGRGHFLEGLAALSSPPHEVIGVEIQPSYGAQAREALQRGSLCGHVQQADLFKLNLSRDLKWHTAGRLLIVGNPPWVTNSELGVLQSANLPRKSNLKALNGLDALTGAANFDLAEFIILQAAMRTAR